jgi:myo-inositol 2-dehydrogenase/D-chiro-inositol 1-dehydrogenase
MIRKTDRRTFMSGAVAGAVIALEPSVVFGTQSNSKIELGLIGCGGRGNWIAKLFNDTGKYRFVACADYFEDRTKATAGKLQIDSKRCYSGLSGYRRLLDGKLDAVVIESPPYFHPEQAAAAVDAGKHVFLAKPVAIDVPGCKSIGASGKKATSRKQVFLVDFQTRANEYYREAVLRVRAGDLGQLVMGEAHYPWEGGGRGARPSTNEECLKSWYYVLEISGDFIVEQSIHALDVATWIAGCDPVRAAGSGGRTLRPEGSIWDHFAVTYWFEDDLLLSFTSIQSIPGVRDEIRCRFFGSEGVIDTDYFSGVSIRGRKSYKGGRFNQLYTTGAQTNIEAFHQSITNRQYANETVAESVRSNLAAILGRQAAYKGGEVTWASLLQSETRLKPDLRGLKG